MSQNAADSRLATNDPGAVRAFVREVGKAVYKPLAGGATVRLVEKGDLSKKRLAALAAGAGFSAELYTPPAKA